MNGNVFMICQEYGAKEQYNVFAWLCNGMSTCIFNCLSQFFNDIVDELGQEAAENYM